MGNGKKARYEKIDRGKPAVSSALSRAEELEKLEKGGEGTLPESFVVVLAYDRTEEDTSEEFAKLVEDFKALFSLRDGHRVYALVEDAAAEVLSVVEKPAKTDG